MTKTRLFSSFTSDKLWGGREFPEPILGENKTNTILHYLGHSIQHCSERKEPTYLIDIITVTTCHDICLVFGGY